MITRDHLQALIAIRQQLGNFPDEAVVIEDDSSLHPQVLHLIRLLRAHESGDASALVSAFVALRSTQKTFPDEMYLWIHKAYARLGRTAEMADPIFDYAQEVLRQGRPSECMQALKAIHSFADSGGGRYLKDEKLISEIGGMYAACAKLAPPVIRRERRPKAKKRLALVTVKLIDHVQAWAKTVMQFTRYLDRDKYELFVYFEESTCKRPQVFSLRFEADPTSIRNAPDYVAELNTLGQDFICVPGLPFIEAATWLAQSFEDNEIDSVIYQGGINAPIQIVSSQLSHCPAIANLCIGINNYIDGFDATFYSNGFHLAKEKTFWRSSWGRQIEVGVGVDYPEAEGTPSLPRERFGIPEGWVTFGTMTNFIEDRIGEEYLDCVASVLLSCDNSIFICIGRGETSTKIEYLKKYGVDKRCLWLPLQTRPFAALKLLDIYANEFPVGGQQSVGEAIACGVAATAMRYSDAHHESVAANLIGPPHAILERDPRAYVGRIVEWIRDPAARKAAAKELSERFRRSNSAEIFVNKLAGICDQIATEKRPQ